MWPKLKRIQNPKYQTSTYEDRILYEPKPNIDLNEFLTKGPESEELQSAASVDEGYVKVVDVLSFTDDKEEVQGPTLSRAA